MTTRMLALVLAVLAVPALAQDVPATGEAATPNPAASPAASEPDDTDIDPVDPDFNLIALPTGVRIPRGGAIFRLTHRFSRPLGEGDLGDLASDFFGFDSGAQIGFEVRYGLRPGFQLGVHRTNAERTIQVFGLFDVWRNVQHPVGLAVLGSIEGLDNLTEDHSPALGLVVSRRLGERGTVYAVPEFVGNTNLTGGGDGDDSTLMLGLGARLRFGRKSALLVEFTPRLAGHRERSAFNGEETRDQLAFGLERRVGGHAFQLNFQNSFGTTPAQIARGGTPGSDWYIGFNLSRRFF